MQADAVKRKRDEEISTSFERAKENLNGLLRSKKQVIRDLALELERLGRPVDHIAAEIVHELRECEDLSKSLIYSYLDEKYKDPSHSSRRRGKKTKKLVPETGTEQVTGELAAEEEAQLKPEVLVQAYTSGHSIQQKQPTAEAETEQQPNHDTETALNSDISASKPATITEQQVETARPAIGGIGQQQQPACKHCRAKDVIIKAQDTKIMDLEEVVRAHTLIKPAEELIHSSTDGYQQVEFSVPFEPLREYIHFNWNRSLDRVWFIGKLNSETGELIDVRIGRRTDIDSTDNSRMTP
jgi:hypothetical protein